MRLRSIRERRADLLADPHLLELFSERPELLEVADAYLWSYPHSPGRSRRRLALVGVLALGGLVGAVVVVRRCRV